MRAATALKLRRIHDPHHRLALVLALLLLLFGSSCFTCQAQPQLDKQEVNTLRQIASKLRMNWNFSVDPCSGTSGWVDPPNSNLNIVSNLTCDCNDTTNVCHVTSIQLNGQNLTGELPGEFANLTSLTFLELNRNYLNGSIPVVWSSLRLQHLSIFGNRISGNIPMELGRITTLQNLTLEANQLQGPIPAALGNLVNLERFHADSNGLTGELPEELGNMKNMMKFSIDGNPISGNIPSFIGNWIKLQNLNIEGTSLTGPFPPNFSNLESITELRASGLKGDGKFPPLQKMKGMKTLVLRNMSISGEIPEYVGNMSNIKILDLSFNNLTGSIPSSFDGLDTSMNYMFLTNNMLNGTIPNWVLRSKKYLDLSYNEFTGNPAPSSCQQGFVNLVSSYSSEASNSISTCLQRNLPCSGKAKNYEFFINCGGQKVTIAGKEYEEDSSQFGSSSYVTSNSGKWAYSSTGFFLGNDKEKFIATNSSQLNMSNPELYMNARLSPLSLRYYGICLQKGNYSVNLHFAETMFTNDETYSSVGKRLFDVSIQGQKVLQDFDITKNASGTGRVTITNFTTYVEDGTLEIHFQWAGKGTISIPQKSVYGPLISAISVTPNFTPDLFEGSKLSIGAILGIVAATCVVIVSILVLCWFFCRRKDYENNELRGLELQTSQFSLRQIKSATKNFAPENKIGEGGFGPVFKGELPDGAVIAVKQLSSKSRQGNREFINEIGMISALQHPNLVKLFGCCVEGRQLFLIYEYLENNSLARALFGPETQRLNLDWETRCKICLGIARGLVYLHEESRFKIVHRDIKATNVLLDKDLNAKISDFGLARLDEGDNTHISTRIAGTVGYMAPEYAMRGYLTDKADVYSFGVVILEIVSGMSNTSYKPKENCVYLLDWAYVLQERGSLLDLVDPTLGPNYSKEEAMKMLDLALLCTNPSSTLRPQMSTVIKMLEGKIPVHFTSVKSSEMSEIEDKRFKSFERLPDDSRSQTNFTFGSSADTTISVQSSREESASYSAASKLLDLTE